MFVMQQIPRSNLLLLVTDPTCDCSFFPPVLQEATEVKYILPSPGCAGEGVGG
jgi:voltage-dependent calcium channel alpha-2/delta-4